MRHNDERLLATHWPGNGAAPLLLRLRGIRGLPAVGPGWPAAGGVSSEESRERQSESRARDRARDRARVG